MERGAISSERSVVEGMDLRRSHEFKHYGELVSRKQLRLPAHG